MTRIQLVFAILSAIVLFSYALRSFSRELHDSGGPALRVWLSRATSSRWRGFALGAAATAIIQSSSAVTALAVALVDGATLSFRASLGVLLGANVGTTATAWLVSYQLTGIGPFFIVVGALASPLLGRYRVLGQPIFYFGLIFFALDVLSTSLAPLKEQTLFMRGLDYAQYPLAGVLLGIVVTAIVQSSSVTTGLVILFVQQGMLPPEAGIPIVVGTNVGTTSTALLASVQMSSAARATAVANFLFNAAGVILFLPFLSIFSERVVQATDDPSEAVAWAHLIFNLSVAGGFLVALPRIEPLLAKRLGISRTGSREDGQSS